jgi:hypothetical protein
MEQPMAPPADVAALPLLESRVRFSLRGMFIATAAGREPDIWGKSITSVLSAFVACFHPINRRQSSAFKSQARSYMQSKAATVAEYLAELPEDRRRAIEAVRKVILENLDSDYEEGMQYGVIGYYVPHRVYPAGYHCDSKQPLPFAGLASQKNYMSLYLMCTYGDTPLAGWFREAWAKTGKKLDAGKACTRFKKVDDLALDVIGEAIRRMPAKKYIAVCEAARSQSAGGSSKQSASKSRMKKATTAK